MPFTAAGSASGLSSTLYVVTAVVGVVSGVLITLGTELAKAHYLRPKLVIMKDSPENGPTWSIHTVVVRNTGKSVARNCVGWITIDDLGAADLVDASQRTTIADLGLPFEKFNLSPDGRQTFLLGSQDFRPVQGEDVAWSRQGNPLAIDIYRDSEEKLDLYMFVEALADKPSQIHLLSETGWKSIRAAAITKAYQIEVSVVAENAPRPERKCFIVNHEDHQRPMILIAAGKGRG